MDASVTEYARMLAELEALNDADKEDSPEADALCDRMDLVWYAMTAEQQDEASGRTTAGPPRSTSPRPAPPAAP